MGKTYASYENDLSLAIDVLEPPTTSLDTVVLIKFLENQGFAFGHFKPKILKNYDG